VAAKAQAIQEPVRRRLGGRAGFKIVASKVKACHGPATIRSLNKTLNMPS